MKYIIRGDKLTVTKAIKDYIESKLSKLDKYYENHQDIECKVVIRSKNNLQTIEVTIPLKKFILRGEESDKDLYAAIDLVVDKLERQIRKNKDRIKNKYDQKEISELILDFDVEEEKILILNQWMKKKLFFK